MPLNIDVATRLLAQRDFARLELVLSVPRSLCLTEEANQQGPEERMAAALLREKSLGQKSQFRAPWYVYVMELGDVQNQVLDQYSIADR